MRKNRPRPPIASPPITSPLAIDSPACGRKKNRAPATMMDEHEIAAIRQRLEALERLLERSFTLPGIHLPIGLDAIIGLIPVFGDVLMAALGSYFIWEAKRLGLPRWQIWRMATHIAIDGVLGAIPLAGDVFDMVYRSNTRNLNIILRHLERQHRKAPSDLQTNG